MAAETWRAVLGFEGLYEVSDGGRVRSVTRATVDATGRRRPVAGRILSPARHPESGHLLVCLGRGHTRKVHHLVLEAFRGPRPSGMEGCHRNDVPTDNSPGNLYWGTRAENQRDQVRNGRHCLARRDRDAYGHLFTGDNLLARKGGGRRCRACAVARSWAYWRRCQGELISSDQMKSYANSKYREMMIE